MDTKFPYNVTRKEIPLWLRIKFLEAAKEIHSVTDLRAYAERFPSPKAGEIIIKSIEFFAEPKVTDGKRDGKKIHEHVSLGFGPRLEGVMPLSLANKRSRAIDLLIGIGLWTEKNYVGVGRLLSSRPPLHEQINHKKQFGVEDPRLLVNDFLFILGNVLRDTEFC